MSENNIFEEKTEVQTAPGQKRRHAPSLVLGILTIVLGLLFPIVGYVLGIIGLVMAVVKRKTFNTKAGLICSIIGLAVSLLNHIGGAMLLTNLGL